MGERRRVLIITYYWPPAGGSGVQRWLKFTKYLRQFGWEPVIYTATNPESPAQDEKLLQEIPEGIEVIKRPVLEPHNLFRWLTGRKGEKFGAGMASSGSGKQGLLGRLAIWVRGNIFIPDARMLWIRPSARFLAKYLKQHPVDAMVSTGPPHSTHLIARRVAHRTHIPWLADFRDPWTNIDFFEDFKPTPWAKAIHARQERQVLRTAQRVVTVTNGWAEELSELGDISVEVIENGYDPDDFPNIISKEERGTAKFSLTHVGTLSPNRNSNLLWKVLGEKVQNDTGFAQNFQLQLVGSVDATARAGIEQNGLLPYTNFMGYLPHNEAIEAQMQSAALLLLVNQSPNALGIQTGKVFEYMAAGRPIIAVGPIGGDTHQLMNETKAGVFVDYTSEDSIREGIDTLWSWYSENFVGFSPSGFERYSRKALTRKVAGLLDEIVA